MKLAFVVQRYGPGVDGGSESLCRAVAERIAADSEDSVEVLTTTATDYLRWRNDSPAGATEEGGVVVRRFSVASERRPRRFGRLSEKLYRKAHTVEDEIDWMIRQGPRSLDLLAHLRRTRGDYDAYVFFTYLYYSTWFGLPLVAERSVLVPTLHDEPPARFEIFRSLFHQARAFVWNTPEERALAEQFYGVRGGEVAGLGFDPAPPPPVGFRERHGLGDYLLCAGRVDVWKGIPDLLEHFAALRRSQPDLELVLIGKVHMKLPKVDGLRSLGFVSEAEKRAAFAEASATVVASPFESLSVVALESWAAGTPVVANAASAALAGQCARSGAGLTYTDSASFVAAVAEAREQAEALGAAGRRFVESDCRWERILEVYRGAARRVAARADGAPE